MSLQFSRSMRSLNVDSFRPSRIGLLLAILIMVGLIFWFFFARITLYEISSEISYTQDSQVLAKFAPTSMARIRQGQPVILRISGGTDQKSLNFSGYVFEKKSDNQIEIVITDGDLPPEVLEGNLSGQADVEVEYITPVTLVMRASGRFLNKSRLPMSPQTRPTVEP